MNCNELNGLNGSCSTSVAGIKKVWIIPFNDISEYTYNPLDLNFVTGYSTSTLPTQYAPNFSSSEYKSKRSLSDYKEYAHEVLLTFTKMTTQKREELIKLEAMDMTLIIQDRNNTCWIMGQDYPVKMEITEMGTGMKGGFNGYKLTFNSVELNPLKKINEPSDTCFVSFKGKKTITSEFTIINANSVNWTNFQVAANNLSLSFTASYRIDPTLWVTPSVMEADLIELLGLFNQSGNTFVVGQTLIGSYNAGTDTVTLTLISLDTEFTALVIQSTLFNATIHATLNLTTLLSPTISNPSTTIKLSDSMGTVFSEQWGNSVAAPSIIGTSENFNIDVSTAYPNGTIFTMSITGLPCATASYQYSVEPSMDICKRKYKATFGLDNISKIFVPFIIDPSDASCPKYQRTTLNLQGNTYQLYYNYTTWHSDDNQFQNDLFTLLSQIQSIDVNSLVFDYSDLTGVSITFSSYFVTQSNVFSNCRVEGYPQPLVNPTSWVQGHAITLNTSAPYPSVITIEDNHSNKAFGENLVSVDHNDFRSSPSFSNTSIDHLGILWAFDNSLPYDESDDLTIKCDSPTCFVPNQTVNTKTCDFSFSTLINSKLHQMTFDLSTGVNLGNQFELVYDNGGGNITEVISLSGTLSPNANLHLLTGELNKIDNMQVISSEYDIDSQKLDIYMLVLDVTTIVSFKALVGNRSASFNIRNNATHVMNSNFNPYIFIRWDLGGMAGGNLTSGIFLVGSSTIQFTIAYNAGTDIMNVNYNSFPTLATKVPYTFTLHDTYPSPTNAKYVGVFTVGNSAHSFSNVDTTLIGNGSSISSVMYIAITNPLGWRYISAINLTGPTPVLQFERKHYPSTWGLRNWIRDTLWTATPTVIVTSSECP